MVKALCLTLITMVGLANMPIKTSPSSTDLARFAPVGGAVNLFPHGNAGTSRYYNYCPSIFEEDGIRHIYYCTNQDWGNVTDYVGYRQGTYTAGSGWTYSDLQYVLGPGSSGQWDARHTCDPAVVKGVFSYQGETYHYLMAYLGSAQNDSMGNESGFAVAKTPAGPWIKCTTLNPFIPFDAENDVWGNGQACMINLDYQGRIIYFYSHGGKDGTYEIVCEYELSNLDSPVLIRKSRLYTNGQIPNDITNNDAEFSYDEANRRLIMVKAKHPYNTDGFNPSFICERLILYVLDLSDDVQPFDEVFKGASMKNWEYLGEIDKSVSGFDRNHNPGLVTDPYGRNLSSEIIEVNYAVCVCADDFWSQLSTYRIYGTSFVLNYGKFAPNRLNKGAKITMSPSSSTSDVSTLRINLGTVSTIGEGLYFRFRNYKSINTPLEMRFEDRCGYQVQPTANMLVKNYSVDGEKVTDSAFRSFGSYLILPANFDGHIYIPYASLTTNEVGTRCLDHLQYIYLSISAYYDGYAHFAIGDIFTEYNKTILDVSQLSMGQFNSTFLAISNPTYMGVSRLPETDFNPVGKDYLGGIRMTINQDSVDRPAQWVLYARNFDLSGEGLYFRMKNNHCNPYYLIFYLLDKNNHRMQLEHHAPIYYYDSSADFLATHPAREFGTYFYLPGSFDGFIFIPYSSLKDEVGWAGNEGTTMNYANIHCVYFGASSKYDYLLDVIIGDVFTTHTYLYDGSLSRYDDLATHAQKVWEVDYVNLEYVAGYLDRVNCFALDFLAETDPCPIQAPVVWAAYASEFATLSSEEQQLLREADYTAKSYAACSHLEKCAWRYDLAVKNLGLNNFMNRTIPSSGLAENALKTTIDERLALITLTSLFALFGIYLLRKKVTTR
ncbi:MAG: hypothetical protein ACOX3K_05720 [Bacilli bacterium]